MGKYNMIVGIAAAAGSMIDHPDTIDGYFPACRHWACGLAAYANVKMAESKPNPSRWIRLFPC